MKSPYTIAWYFFFGLTLICVMFWTTTLFTQYRTINTYKRMGRMKTLQKDLSSERKALNDERHFLNNYIKAGRKDTGLLKKIGELDRDFDINFVSTGPIVRKTSGNYIKTMRRIAFEGNYFETVRFLNNMEKVKEINVSDLSILKLGEKKYFVELEANNFSLKDKANFTVDDEPLPDNASSLYEDIHETSALLPIPTPDSGLTFMQMLVVRDPFAEPPLQVFPASAVSAGEKIDDGSLYERRDMSSSTRKGLFVLTGIINYPGYSMIIVEGTDRIPKSYKSGDQIGNNKIVSIGQDQVVINEGDGKERNIKIGAQFF